MEMISKVSAVNGGFCADALRDAYRKQQLANAIVCSVDRLSRNWEQMQQCALQSICAFAQGIRMGR